MKKWLNRRTGFIVMLDGATLDPAEKTDPAVTPIEAAER